MFEYIAGKIKEITPTYIVIDNDGIGYFIHISIYTYSAFQHKEECKIYIHQVIREDANILYGFYAKEEREIFRHLISVSGVGANTARIILSSLSASEIHAAITQSDVNLLTSIKGIGTKSAQRLIIELKDKLEKSEIIQEIIPSQSNTFKEQSLSALVTLGFPKNNVEKILNKLILEQPESTVEELVKKALKLL